MPYYRKLETVKHNQREAVEQCLLNFIRSVRRSNLPGTYKSLSVRQALTLASHQAVSKGFLNSTRRAGEKQ